jgi:hypothetical protein
MFLLPHFLSLVFRELVIGYYYFSPDEVNVVLVSLLLAGHFTEVPWTTNEDKIIEIPGLGLRLSFMEVWMLGIYIFIFTAFFQKILFHYFQNKQTFFTPMKNKTLIFAALLSYANYYLLGIVEVTFDIGLGLGYQFQVTKEFLCMCCYPFLCVFILWLSGVVLVGWCG